MAKGSALAIVALLIGIGGLSVGGYSLFSVLTESGVHRTYYDQKLDTYTTPSSLNWYDIPDISILFQVDAGESVYFSFTCIALIDPLTAVAQMSFRLKIDGFSIIDSWATVGPTSTGISDIFLSVALQWRNASLSA